MKSADAYEREAKKEYKNAQNMSNFISQGSKEYNDKNVSDAYQRSAKNWLEYLKAKNPPLDKRVEILRTVYQTLNYAKKRTPIKDEKEDISKLRKKVGDTIADISGKIPKKKSIERRAIEYAVLSISSLVFALIFASFSLTGYSVLELTQNNSRFIGTIFFILGLVFAFVYFKRRKGK